MYGVLILLKCIMGLVQYYALLRFCQNASVNLHNAMTVRVMGATMSFFDTHFIGNILNRFSYDLNNIDEHIPFMFPGLAMVSLKLQLIINSFNQIYFHIWSFLHITTLLKLLDYIIAAGKLHS